MAELSSAGRLTSYKALPPPKKQVSFRPRRQTIRPGNPALRLKQDQSTLTQFDFESTPKPSGTEVSDLSDDDGEFTDPRPKKRRRTTRLSRAAKDQKTLTQMDGGLSRKCVKPIDLDSQGWEIWEDSEEEKMPLPENHAGMEETIVKETSPIKSSPSTAVKSFEDAKLEPSALYSTPQRARPREIPSSQTPPSEYGLTPRSLRKQEDVKSPLQIMSNNIRPMISHRRAADSQPEVMRLLEEIRLRKLSSRSDEENLRRMLEELPSDDEALFSIDDRNIAHSSQHFNISAKHPPNSLGRKKDTRLQHLDHDNFDTATSQKDCERAVWISSPPRPGSLAGNDFDSQPATYDPAYDALARDAERFGWTQRQKIAEIPDSNDEASETDDDDLDRGCAAGDSAEEQPAPRTGTTAAEVHRSNPSPSARAVDPPDQSDDYPVATQSSQPAVCQSEVSTVVPTSGSGDAQSLIPSSQQLSCQSVRFEIPAIPSRATKPSMEGPSQPRSLFSLPETLSSSPLPMPPGPSQDHLWLQGASSATEQRSESTSTTQLMSTVEQRPEQSSTTQFDSVLDFSLPPPPSLSFGRR